MFKFDTQDLEASADPSASRSEYVYLALRAAIHEGRLCPGERVRENQIAEQLGVSRTPVRDALKRLESDRLLVFTPRRGLAVAKVDQQAMIELFALREMLDGMAAELAARHASDGEIALLHDLLARQRQIPADDALALMQQNLQFHQAILDAARNRYLVSALHAVGDAIALLGPTAYVVKGRPAIALAEHERLVEAITRRDAPASSEAARAHIRAAVQVRLALTASGAVSRLKE